MSFICFNLDEINKNRTNASRNNSFIQSLPNRPLTLDLKIAFNQENKNSTMSTTSTNDDDENIIEAMIENSKNSSIKPKSSKLADPCSPYSPNCLSRSASIRSQPNNQRNIRNSNDQNHLKSSSIMPTNHQLASSSISLSSSLASSSVPSSISPATSPRMVNALQQPTQQNQNNQLSQSPNLLNIHQYLSSSLTNNSNNLPSPSGNTH